MARTTSKATDVATRKAYGSALKVARATALPTNANTLDSLLRAIDGAEYSPADSAALLLVQSRGKVSTPPTVQDRERVALAQVLAHHAVLARAPKSVAPTVKVPTLDTSDAHPGTPTSAVEYAPCACESCTAMGEDAGVLCLKSEARRIDAMSSRPRVIGEATGLDGASADSESIPTVGDPRAIAAARLARADSADMLLGARERDMALAPADLLSKATRRAGYFGAYYRAVMGSNVAIDTEDAAADALAEWYSAGEDAQAIGYYVKRSIMAQVLPWLRGAGRYGNTRDAAGNLILRETLAVARAASLDVARADGSTLASVLIDSRKVRHGTDPLAESVETFVTLPDGTRCRAADACRADYSDAEWAALVAQFASRTTDRPGQVAARTTDALGRNWKGRAADSDRLAVIVAVLTDPTFRTETERYRAYSAQTGASPAAWRKAKSRALARGLATVAAETPRATVRRVRRGFSFVQYHGAEYAAPAMA